MNNNNFDFKNLLFITGNVLVLSLALLAIMFAVGEKKSWGHQANQGATITVSGEGEVMAVPDISIISFTVRSVAKTVPESQKKTEDIMKPTNDGLSKLGVVTKDIKTISYTVNPKYTYESQVYCMSINCPRPTSPKLEGYEVAETVQIKVRKIDNTGKVLALLGTNNITEISGPDFTVDDMEKVNNNAKSLAITNAKIKAEATAKALGVGLSRIVGYSEGNNYPSPSPMMYGLGGAKTESVSDVTIPVGESVIKKTVSITYELE